MSLRSLALAAALPWSIAAATETEALLAPPEALHAPASPLVQALDGIHVEGSLTGLLQQARRHDLDDPGAQRQRANYRGDVAVTLPGGSWGDHQGTLFAHARFGQGQGLALRPTYTGSANSTTFGGSNPHQPQAILAQAWYQLDMPLGGADSARKARFTVGKIDPFMFFDQNSIADDETRHFVNNVFVHNPLLDSGGDIGADHHGFSPGAIAAYEDTSHKAMGWGASLGLFGSGNGAHFSARSGKPFVMAQLWAAPGSTPLPGTYRAYAWSNARAHDFDDSTARHSGVGVSIDQRVTTTLALFGRYGHQTAGQVRFGRALTVGGELDGAAWGRGDDGLGMAWGLLRTSRRFAAASAADTGAYGHGARGAERNGELYYRIHLNEQVEITPSLQYIARPGADAHAKAIRVAGLRARVGF